MGNKGLAESVFSTFSEAETTLAEILYADMGIIESIASMLTRQPKRSETPDAPPEPERRRSPRGRSYADRQDAGLLIDAQASSAGKTLPGPKTAAPQPEPPAAPADGDARIMAVLRALDIPKTKGAVMPSSDRSLLVHLEGQLQYYQKQSYERIMQREADLKRLLEPPEAQTAQDLASVNLDTLKLEAVSISEDDLTGYAGLLGDRTTGSALMTLLPDGPGFILTLRGNKRPFYIPLDRRSLRYGLRRLENLFPSFQLGNWKVLAYFPAPPRSGSRDSEETAPTFWDTVSSQVAKQTEVQAACGFPGERLQPILIYRDVTAARL